MGKGGESAMKKASKFTWEQVKEHNTPEDAWIVYKNKVYNVSNWHEHPGGAVIYTHAGDDMTDIFAAMHAAGSYNMLRKFLIGDLIPETTPKDLHQINFEKGYRDLRAKMVEIGLFKSRPSFYVYKCISTQCLWVTAFAMVYFSESTVVHLSAALLMGLFFQQCGWLAHDFLHHQVFRKRKYGDYAGIYWGNLMQGYSMQWWKNKHNGHHAVPNLHNSSANAQDGDPDIDTMPLLAWSLFQAKQGGDSKVTKFFIKYQAYLYFPILLLARISWLNESFKVSYGIGAATENAALELKMKGLQYPFLEKVGVALHYVWMLAFVSGFGRFSFFHSFTLFMVATCSCGWFLAIVFGLGHNGMATYNAATRPDFWKLQVTTTRNITGGHGIPQAFIDWFCGGLQYQVEHHLFPMLPRHSLKETHKLVESFCKEWKVQYHEADIVVGTREVLQHLDQVAAEFVADFLLDGPTM